MLKVKSREYKVMLQPELFEVRRPAVEAFLSEVQEKSKLVGVKSSGKLKSPEKKIIRFLDTPDFTLRRNGFVLRRRDLKDTDETQFALKVRSPDRYFAQGVDVAHDTNFEAKEKLEEHIAAVFRSRFSHSMTLTMGRDDAKSPTSVKKAGKLFPVLDALRCDGRVCPPKTKLEIVNGVVAHERVYDGFALHIGDTDASVAIILWTKGRKGRPLTAEFSFRYKDKKEHYSAKLPAAAQRLFLSVQQLDWCAPGIPTKTQYVYEQST